MREGQLQPSVVCTVMGRSKDAVGPKGSGTFFEPNCGGKEGKEWLGGVKKKG